MAYHQEVDLLGRRYFALYQALWSEAAIARFMEVLGLTDWPFYQQFLEMTEGARRETLRNVRCRGLTAARRFRHLVYDLYEVIQRESLKLHEQYSKIATHVKLLNEDIDKFNQSYDFGLIAAQMEALDGHADVISGGLFAPEREELSTRMRLKRQKLTPTDLPELPVLPPLGDLKARLAPVLAHFCRERPPL